MKKVFFLSAVSGVGKTTTCDYIENNNLLKNYNCGSQIILENETLKYKIFTGADKTQSIK